MLLKKRDYPEENEIVLCTVTNVQHHSVFCRLDEYERKSGIIHIAEISPGRIRNIRDYVKEGKVIFCKVLRVNKERGHIDLSLRRVSEGQRRAKADGLKQEQKAEKIVEIIAKEMKVPLAKIFPEISEKITQKYESVYDGFEDVVENDISLADLGVDAKIAEKLEKLIRIRIKPQEVEISGDLTILSHAPDGVTLIKSVLEKADSKDENLTITYEGGGKYKVDVKSSNYKDAEKVMKKAVDSITKAIEKADGEIEFSRKED